MFSTAQSFVESRSPGRRKEDLLVREEVSRQEQLLQITRAITSEMNRESLFGVIMEQTNRVMGTEKSVVFLHDERNEEIWSLVSARLKGNEIRFPASHGIAGWVLKNRTPLLVNDAYADPRFSDALDGISGFRTRNILSIPLINLENKAIGVFQTLNKRSGAFLEGDLALFNSLSIYVAIALENSNLYEEIKSMHKAKERCIAHLSHELRTPISIMTMVFARISTTTRDAGIPGLDKLIDRGDRNLQRLLDLQAKIDDILNHRGFDEKSQILHLIEGALDFVEDTRSETREDSIRRVLDSLTDRLNGVLSEQEIHPESVDLGTFLDDLCREAVLLMVDRELEIVRSFEKGLCIWIDPGILQKVCSCLLKNAIENTPDQGRIEVSCRSRDGSILIEVRDYGVGITEENMMSIFEGFFHTQETVWYSSKRPYAFDAGGAGVDLLRTKVFSERHRFSVDFTSRRCRFIPQDADRCPGSISGCTFVQGRSECLESGGSTFSLLFPLRRFAPC